MPAAHSPPPHLLLGLPGERIVPLVDAATPPATDLATDLATAIVPPATGAGRCTETGRSPMGDVRISFVGAGPGADDLITPRGAYRLGEAAPLVWASSLVPEALLDHVRPRPKSPARRW